MERSLPRFQEYLKEFGSRDLSARLQDVLICYYAELIAQYQDAIEFLRAHPISQLTPLEYHSVQHPRCTMNHLAPF